MPKFSKFTNVSKKYFKHNYKDAIAEIIPTNYFVEDITTSGYTIDPLDEIINSHIVAAQNIITLLNISAVGTISGINDFSGISQFFIKQNEKTAVTTHTFERDILSPINIKFSSFETSADWATYVDSELQSMLYLNNPTNSTVFRNVSGPYGDTPDQVHTYFADALGWLYLLNTSAISEGTYSPSSLITKRLYGLYTGSSYETLQGVDDLTEYVWKNYYTSPTLSSIAYITPNTFVSSNSSSTSGVQPLAKLKTLNEVIYSPLAADYLDYRVRDDFKEFESLSSVEGMTFGAVAGGPFHRLIQAMSYSMYDINNQVDGLSELYDIDNVNKKFLPRLAELIGWEFIGDDTDKWRGQLREATRIYKAKGTKRGLEIGLKTLFGDGVFNLSSNVYELYESYIPFMIYYALVTESPLFRTMDKFKENPFNTYTHAAAMAMGVAVSGDYSPTSMETNLEYCVDHILLYLVNNFPEAFKIGTKNFPVGDPDFIFNYRGRNFPIPPFEEIKWYENCSINFGLLTALRNKLACFGVSQTFLESMFDYIYSNSTSGTADDISIGNSFIFYTSSVSSAPNFSTVLDDLENFKAKYLSLWQGKSSHFDTLFYAKNFSYSQFVAHQDTNLGLTKALKLLNLLVPAHAIPRTKVIASFDESAALKIYACLLNNIPINDFSTSSTVLNAYEISGTNMGGTSLSSTGPSKFLVDSLDDLFISSNIAVSAARNNLRRRNFNLTLPREGYNDRTGFNMPMSMYPSSLEKSLPASGGGMELLGYDYSACQFAVPKLPITNENLIEGYGPQIHHPMNLFRDPILSATNFLNDSVATHISEGTWERTGAVVGGVWQGNKLRFGQNFSKDPLGETMIKPILFSGTVAHQDSEGNYTYAIPGNGFYQENRPNVVEHEVAGLEGWKDKTNYTLSYYVKNYNTPGVSPTEVGDETILDGKIETNNKHLPATVVNFYVDSGSELPKDGGEMHIYWSDDKPYSTILGIYFAEFFGTFDVKNTSITAGVEGWYRISHTMEADFSASSTNTTAALVPRIVGEFRPYYLPDFTLVEAQKLYPSYKLPTIDDWRGVYLWGLMLTEGTDLPSVYTPMDNPIWYSCENLNSSTTYKDVDTSNTFPCRGVSSFNLVSALEAGSCTSFRNRGLSPMYKLMYNTFRKKTKKQIEALFPYVSGNFEASSSDWFDTFACIQNSSVIKYVSSTNQVPNPGNILNDPFLNLNDSLVPPCSFNNQPNNICAARNQWRLTETTSETGTEPSPFGPFFSKRFAKNPNASSFIYQDIPGPSGPHTQDVLTFDPGGVSGNHYIFSAYIKNIDAPSININFSTILEGPASGNLQLQNTTPIPGYDCRTTDLSGTLIYRPNPEYWDISMPDTIKYGGNYGGTNVTFEAQGRNIDPNTPWGVSLCLMQSDQLTCNKQLPMTDEIAQRLALLRGPRDQFDALGYYGEEQAWHEGGPGVPKMFEHKFYVGQELADCSADFKAKYPHLPDPIIIPPYDKPPISLILPPGTKTDQDSYGVSSFKELDLNAEVEISFAKNKQFDSDKADEITEEISLIRWKKNMRLPAWPNSSPNPCGGPPPCGANSESLRNWLGGTNEAHNEHGPFDYTHITTSALPKDFGYESVGNGWYRVWIKTQIGPEWYGVPVEGGLNASSADQTRVKIYPAGTNPQNTGSCHIWGPMLHVAEATAEEPANFLVEAFPVVHSFTPFFKAWADYANFQFGQGIQTFYNDYAKIFHVHKTTPALIDNAEGGPNIYSHAYGPLLFNGKLNIKGNNTLVASSFSSPYAIGEDYVSRNSDKWGRSYAIESTNTFVSSNILPYTENFDPRVTTWQYGGSGAGALAASAVFPPWGPLRWGTSSLSGPQSFGSITGEQQFIVQGKNSTNTWDWGAMQLPTPHIAEYMTSSQLFSMYVKKIEGDIPLSATDSFVSSHGMTSTDVAASSQFFGANIVNLVQESVSAGSGINGIEFCWSGTAGGVPGPSGVAVCSVLTSVSSTNPSPSAVTPSDCGNGWWRIGIIVSAMPSAVNIPADVLNGGFTSGQSGRWTAGYPLKGTRQLYIAPAGFGKQTASSLTDCNYRGQFIRGVQLENLSPDQILAFNNSTTSSFADLSSTYHSVLYGGRKSFDISIEGVREYREGSIISGVEMVIPSGSDIVYSTENLAEEAEQVHSFTHEGATYTVPPYSSYFKAFKIHPTESSQYPNNPMVDTGCILATMGTLRTPRLRLPLSNCRYPVYRRDYVDYDSSSYWPVSHLDGQVCSVQNSVDGEASITPTTTDEYLYRRALPDTSGYHGYIYEPKPQVPFNTKTSNLLFPDHDYELTLKYTSFPNEFVNQYGGGRLGVWIHTLPEEGQPIRAYDQALNIGVDGWVWSWTPDGWVKTRVADLEGGDGTNIIHTKLAHLIDIPLKDAVNETTTEEGEGGLLDPATQCLAEDALTPEAAPLRSLTPEDFYTTTISFNTKNKIYNKDFRKLPLSYENHPIGNQGLLHRIPVNEGDFQYYVIDIFLLSIGPTATADKILFKDISIIDKTFESYITDYRKEDISTLLKYYDSITNVFVGTGNASREKYTTSGTFEASGGSRLNYRYNPAWGVHASAGTGAYTSIDFYEGKETTG